MSKRAATNTPAAAQARCGTGTVTGAPDVLSQETSDVIAILLEAVYAMRDRDNAAPQIPVPQVNSLLDTRILELVAASGNTTPQQMVGQLRASRTGIQKSLLRLTTTGKLIGTGRTRGRTYHLPAMEEVAVA